MFSAFGIVRQLHEMLWYLAEAQVRAFDPDLAARAAQLRRLIAQAVQGELPDLLSLDMQDLHSQVRLTLMDISEDVRAPYFAAGRDHLEPELRPGADLMGQSLKFRQLCGADLRGAYLIAADLRGSDLSGTDLLGADLRDARLDGADLSRALYLTQPQINAASGSVTTRLPPEVSTPAHWN
ncbi:pentapeptide repeat-containing protein [Arthrobacter sp. G119Y2]|uniref:pentapeptide repeat-containing protein n=1 Tax=Arthrobacter sp. G119Y2 TaxID=3134965 RepID=UPI003119E710